VSWFTDWLERLLGDPGGRLRYARERAMVQVAEERASTGRRVVDQVSDRVLIDDLRKAGFEAEPVIPKRVLITAVNPALEEQASLTELFLNWHLENNPEARLKFDTMVKRAAKEWSDALLAAELGSST
jgi:hypothetical protein